MNKKIIPNNKALKVSASTDNGIDLNAYSSWEEMIDKIENEVVVNLGEEMIPISKKVPNAQTLKIFEEADRGIGLLRHSSLEDLYKDLGI